MPLLPDRRIGAFLIVILAGSTAGALAAAPLAPVEIVQGVARDPAGRALDEVEVLLSGLLGPARAARVVTDEDGRFLFENLSPGLYRVTAIKSGYQVAMIRINTVVRNTLDLVLRPAGDPPGPGHRPETADWVLRLPRRDLLEQRDAPELDTEDGTLTTVSWRPEITGEVEQWYWAGTPFSDEEVNGSRGLITSLELAAPLTPRFRMRVKGDRFQEDMALSGGSGPSSELVRHRVLFDAGVSTSDRSGLSMQAYVDGGVRDLGALEDASTLGRPQGREDAWGYDALWTTTIGRNASVDVGVGYHDALVDLSGEEAAALYGAPEGEIDTRTMSASGGLTAGLGPRHRVRVEVRAQHFSAGSPGFRVAMTPASGAAPPGVDGWELSVTGSDEWRLGGPFTLSYGVDYRRSVFAGRLAWVVPQVGLAFAPAAGTRLSSTVTWLVDDGTQDAGVGAETPGEGSRLGYRVSLEQGLGRRSTLIVSAEERPAQHDFVGSVLAEDLAAGAAGLLYMGDPAARSRWWSGGWTHRFRGGSGTLEYVRGEVEGRIAARLSGDLPLLVPEPGGLEVASARAEFRWDPSGTILAVRVEDVGAPEADRGEPNERYGQIALFVDQEIPFLKVRDTRWRLMVSVQDGLYGPPQDEERNDQIAALRHALVASQRISGGLAVNF